MIRHPHYRLLTLITDEFDLILHIQHRLAIFHASHIPNRTEHSPRIALITISAQIGEFDPFLAMSIHRRRPFKVLLAPTPAATMQAIGTVVGLQLVSFAIEFQLSVLDAVGGAADGFAKVWCVV